MLEQSTELLRLTEQIGQRLMAEKALLATAESCTGGGISWLLTAVAGSSAWYERGWVTYSNQAKQTCLGVDAAVLERFGAVSRETAAAMCAGVLANAPVTWAVSVTGIAGPTGGNAAKPVGTVYIGWQRSGESAEVGLFHFSGDRGEVREQTLYQALLGLDTRLDQV